MLKNQKSSCISVKFSQISALIGFIGFVAFCIYAALFKYFDLAVFLTIAAGTACAQGYALSRKPLTEYLNLLSVGCYAYALGLFFLNSYNVWADWYGGFTMYGSRGGIGPVIAIMVILLAGCITGTVSCFTVRRDKQCSRRKNGPSQGLFPAWPWCFAPAVPRPLMQTAILPASVRLPPT